WNIGRFLLSNVGTEPVAAIDTIDPSQLTRADRWILARLHRATTECDAALRSLRLNEFAETARRFVWNELADWYLESLKGRLGTPNGTPGADRDVARAVLVYAFDNALRLLHPIVPFITEALWQRLPKVNEPSSLLCTAAWPTPPAPLDGA